MFTALGDGIQDDIEAIPALIVWWDRHDECCPILCMVGIQKGMNDARPNCCARFDFKVWDEVGDVIVLFTQIVDGLHDFIRLLCRLRNIECVNELLYIAVEKRDCLHDLLFGPVPPLDALQCGDGFRIKSILDDACRIADDDGVRRDVLCHDRARTDDGPIANVDTAEDHGIAANPYIAADNDLMIIDWIRMWVCQPVCFYTGIWVQELVPWIGCCTVVVVIGSNLEDEAMGKRRVSSHENVTGRTSYFGVCIDNIRFFSGS